MFQKIHMKCILCGQEKFKHLYKHRTKINRKNMIDQYTASTTNFDLSGELLECNNCGLICSCFKDTQNNVEEIYREVKDYDYLLEKKPRMRTFVEIIKDIEKYKPNGGKLLDVGCHVGWLLSVAHKRGWDVEGIEPSTWAARIAKEKLGLTIFNTIIEKTKLKPNTYDIVIMTDVIEHLRNPCKALEKLYKAIKPNGLIYIATPNINSITSRLLRSRWWAIRNAHLFYFSPKTIKKLLIISNFKVILITHQRRTFLLDYWNKKLSGYNQYLQSVVSSGIKSMNISNKQIKLNLYDSMVIIAQKIG